jgi:hypothetical protein
MNNYQRFIVKNILLTVVLAISGAIVFGTILKTYYHNIFPVLLILALAINIIIYRIAITKVKVNQTFIVLVLSFTIKFFSYLLITILFFLYEKEISYRIAYIFVLLIIFIGFTSIEIKMLSKFFKSES